MGTDHNFNSNSNLLEDPRKLAYQVTFRYYTDYLKELGSPLSKPQDLQDSYDRYKLDFTKKVNVVFFDEMKTKNWFKEKYSEEEAMIESRRVSRAEGREGMVDSFLKEVITKDKISFDYAG